MKYLQSFLTTLALFLVFQTAGSQTAGSQTTDTPGFTGTYRDQDNDLHSFEMQVDGTLLGKMTVGDTVFEVPFELEAGQAYGFLQLEDDTVLGIVLTTKSAEALTVQVVPMDTNNQPILEELQTYTFTQEGILSTTTLGAKPQNPLTAHPTANPLAITSPGSSGVAIAANQSYNTGTTLVSSAAGFSLMVPAGNIATYTTTEIGQAGLVVGDQQSSGFIVLGLSKADILALAQASLSSFGDLQLTPIGTPQQTTDMFRATFQTEANGNALAIHLAARQGPTGNAVVLMGFALLGQDAGLSQAIDSTLASLVFTQVAPQTALNLGGLELNADDGSSTSNTSGDAHLTGIKEEFYVFCSDGSYAYSMEDTTMFSTGGLSGDFSDFSSEESDQHQGRYEISVGILGEPYLFLQADDGRTFFHPVSQSADSLVISNSSFSIRQNSQCQ